MNLALFDLDHTLLDGDSDYAWGEFMATHGLVDGPAYRRKNAEYWERYKNGTLDIIEFMSFSLAPLATQSVERLNQLHREFLQTVIDPMISGGARELIARHRGDLCAIVTATNAFVTRPIAEHLGVPHLIASEVEMKDGRYTGRPTGIPSFREGKVTRVAQWLAGMGKSLGDFPESYFYSDSHNDLPLLLAVNRPVAVNPDATLKQHAEQHQWPIMMLREKELVRS
jgi:HAD superfamily hydrolase (TIGR01490 family)